MAMACDRLRRWLYVRIGTALLLSLGHACTPGTTSALRMVGSAPHPERVRPDRRSRALQHVRIAHHLAGGAGDVVVDVAGLALGEMRAPLAQRLLQVLRIHRQTPRGEVAAHHPVQAAEVGVRIPGRSSASLPLHRRHPATVGRLAAAVIATRASPPRAPAAAAWTRAAASSRICAATLGDGSGGLPHQDERLTTLLPVLWLAIGEARQPSEVAPVRAGGIAAVPLGQGLRRHRGLLGGDGLLRHSQPRLVIARARLHHDRLREPVVLEADDRCVVEIIQQDDAHASVWPNVYVTSDGVHPLEPGDAALHLGHGPRSQEHPSRISIEDADLVAGAAHGRDLHGHRAGCPITMRGDVPIGHRRLPSPEQVYYKTRQ